MSYVETDCYATEREITDYVETGMAAFKTDREAAAAIAKDYESAAQIEMFALGHQTWPRGTSLRTAPRREFTCLTAALSAARAIDLSESIAFDQK